MSKKKTISNLIRTDFDYFMGTGTHYLISTASVPMPIFYSKYANNPNNY